MKKKKVPGNRVVPLGAGDLRVHDGARRRVGHPAVDVGKKPAADALLHHHHTQLGPRTTDGQTDGRMDRVAGQTESVKSSVTNA